MTSWHFGTLLAGMAGVTGAFVVQAGIVSCIRGVAGVAPDTGTPVDIVGWYLVLATTLAIWGSVGCSVQRTMGWQGVTASLGIGIILAVLIAEESPVVGLMLEGFAAVFGPLRLLSVGWGCGLSYAAGWWVTSARWGAKSSPWTTMAIGGTFLACGVISLAVVYYPLEMYFMSIWG